jgi:hypothetical protein
LKPDHTYKLAGLTKRLGTRVVTKRKTKEDKARCARMGDICIVCRDEVITHPCETVCGHICCAICMIGWVLENGQCPHCRHEMSFGELVMLKEIGIWMRFLAEVEATGKMFLAVCALYTIVAALAAYLA